MGNEQRKSHRAALIVVGTPGRALRGTRTAFTVLFWKFCIVNLILDIEQTIG